ncbi:type II toxin-antitoxin system RelE/ParE family toxin [Aquibacillus koreensis]|uniref:Type II toxin-antitoxin system RelE/ParE family toxin n=1 Tax=Aquibacillus koreensis TaxID=279446 RepID=A0A9X4AJ93_9BACI|nr:type II toxin-antitoxin system RelE/ParE family toxin [Aquibacillus koreensis]MCT2536705.1 type II toxin-antitoxin system RelE/ParE family toxin [Aquibacillus koreensis]MDC3421539.1 type II toxin-antitoxin system RelE/ParE family toxin [Aquibacillus koreensis]
MYELLYSKQAVKYIKKQDKPTRKRIREALLTLAEDPYHRGILDISSLKGVDSAFRLRVGDFRIIYEVKDKELIIYVISAGSRGDINK